MNTYTKTMKLLGAAGLMALAPSSALWAESASPRGDPGLDFLGAHYDPNASGPKLSGTLSMVYEKTADSNCSLGSRITKMHLSITMGQNQTYAPFTRSHDGGFCLGAQEGLQAELIMALIREKVIPVYANCTPTCPGFKVKSIADYQYTSAALGDRQLPPDPNSGGFSATFTIALQ